MTNPTDALSLLAIERHVLAICRESQTMLLEIHANNRRLGEMFGTPIYEVEMHETESRDAVGTASGRSDDDMDRERTGVSAGEQASVERSVSEQERTDVHVRNRSQKISDSDPELVAIVNRNDQRLAILRIEDRMVTVRETEVIESGQRVTEIHADFILLSDGDGTIRRIE